MTSNSSLSRDEYVSALETGEYEITYIKLDGVTKTFRGTRIPELLPVPIKEIYEEYITLWSITDDGWRTIVPSRITGFTGPL